MTPQLYSYLVFVHVCSVIGLFVAIALEAAALYRRGTTTTDSALAVLVLLGELGPIVTGCRVTRIRAALATEDRLGESLPDAIVRLLVDPVLLGYAPIPAAMGLGIVGLMVFKLNWTGCVEVLCASLVIGLAIGQLAVRRMRTSRLLSTYLPSTC